MLLVAAAGASAQDGTSSQASNASPAVPVRLGQAPDEAPAVEPTVIPFELLINRPMVRVTINGQGPFGLLLGPEEQQSRIDPELAELLKIRQPEAGQPMLTIDVAFSPKYSARVPIAIQDMSAVAADLPAPLRPRGIISLSTWSDELVTLDYSRWKISIEPGVLPEPDQTKVFALNDAGELRLPLSLGGEAVECHVDPWFPAALLLPTAAVEEGQLAGEPRDKGTIATKAATLRVHEGRLATEVVLGPFEVKTPFVLISESAAIATVGTPFLARYAITYDIVNGRVKLERPNKEQTRSRN